MCSLPRVEPDSLLLTVAQSLFGACFPWAVELAQLPSQLPSFGVDRKGPFDLTVQRNCVFHVSVVAT